MNLAAALSARGVTFDELSSRAQTALGLTPGDILFACGSLVEGLGNNQSDIDLVLITSREDIVFTSVKDVFFTLGGSIVEVRVRQSAEVDALLERFEQWVRGPRDSRGSLAFSGDDRKFLHRLFSGQPIFGQKELRHLLKDVNVADLAWHRFEWARHFADTLLIDLAGFHEEGDPYTMLFAAQELLSHTIDGLLAGHGYTNPTPKWRARHLRELPADWEAMLPGRQTGLRPFDRFLALNRAPETVTLREVTQYALRIVAFSRSVFVGIERQKLGGASAAPKLPVASAGTEGDSLPCLDLSVALRCHEKGFDIVRLNGSESPIALSPEAGLLLCLFDGETSYESAVNYVNHLLSSEKGEELLKDLMALIEHARLTIQRDIDEDLLEKTLALASSTPQFFKRPV